MLKDASALRTDELIRTILLGAPGAGKGTQAAFICRSYGIPHIATGDMLRDELQRGTLIGRRAKGIMEKGELVPDDVVITLVRRRVGCDREQGFLLDGFPRTVAQARAMEDMPIDCVVEIVVDDEVIVHRLGQRRAHLASGRVYHMEYNPPKCKGVDDETGEPLVLRDDDKPDTVIERLRVYHEQTRPLSDYYKERAARGELTYIEIDGMADIQTVQAEISRQLETVVSR